MPQKKHLTMDWKNFSVNGWISNASTLSIYGAKFCPVCKAPFANFIGKGTVKNDSDGVWASWKAKCRCGARLAIFNDRFEDQEEAA